MSIEKTLRNAVMARRQELFHDDGISFHITMCPDTYRDLCDEVDANGGSLYLLPSDHQARLDCVKPEHRCLLGPQSHPHPPGLTRSFMGHRILRSRDTNGWVLS